MPIPIQMAREIIETTIRNRRHMVGLPHLPGFVTKCLKVAPLDQGADAFIDAICRALARYELDNIPLTTEFMA